MTDMSASLAIRLYQFEPVVSTLGPGRRACVWTQGCPFSCAGCIAPDSQPPRDGAVVPIQTIVKRVRDQTAIEGVTISGGEPFAQAAAVAALCTRIRAVRPELTFMFFSGYTLQALRARQCADVDTILEVADILVDGLFREDLPSDKVWLGSANQRVHFLSTRYGPRDLESAKRGVQVLFGPTGMFLAGIPSRPLARELAPFVQHQPPNQEDAR